jgi:hypothetical protein
MKVMRVANARFLTSGVLILALAFGVSRLTVFYSIGQMCGPVLAAQLQLRFKSYNPALLAAAGVICIATIITMLSIGDVAPKSPQKGMPNIARPIPPKEIA